MAIVRVTGNIWLQANANSGTGVSRAFANNVTAGSLLVAAGFQVPGGSALSFSDASGNTWAEAVNVLNTDLGRVAIGYAKNANAGATTVTCTGGSGAQKRILILEVTGADITAPLDGTPTTGSLSSGSSATANPGSITTTDAALFVGAAFTYGALPVVGSGYTMQYDVEADSMYRISVEDFISSSSGASDPGYTTVSGNFSYYAVVGAAFKVQGAGGGSGGGRLTLLGVG